MVEPPPRTDIRARLDALPDPILPGAHGDDDDPSGAVIVWMVLAFVVYLVGIVLVMVIRSFW